LLIIASAYQTNKCLGQEHNILNNERIFAKGEIFSFPDSIYIFENQAQLGKFENYTRLDKINSNRYKIFYWEMSHGGIVDPTLYKYDLILKVKDNSCKLKIGKYKKVYDWSTKDDNLEHLILLTAKTNNH
jgi:hypothetical protein